jgi:hypothetical protein
MSYYSNIITSSAEALDITRNAKGKRDKNGVIGDIIR